MYAIRNRNDPSIYFHYPKSGGRKAFTQIAEFEAGKMPRLFQQRRHATSALQTWLAGKLVSGYEDDQFTHTKLQRVHGRKKEDWEVVEVMVVPVSRTEHKSRIGDDQEQI